MATTSNSKPARPIAPVVVRQTSSKHGSDFWRLFPAALISAVFHCFLFGMLFVVSSPGQAGPPQTEQSLDDKNTVASEDPPPEKSDPLITTDIDPAAQEFDTDINFKVDRKADVSIPGMVNPAESVGILNAPKDAPPVNLPAPGGFGSKGQGGALESALMQGTSMAPGMVGGYGLRGVPLAGSFFGRSGATREFALRDGGGTKESEAAVALGLKWIAKQQSSDGSWKLDGKFPDKGQGNDVAGTALGLLPLLGAGKTHKPAPENPYDKSIEKALLWLIRSKQDKRTGSFTLDMYAHGLATIAMCEAYGLSQDPTLRKPAQMAVNFIVNSQHEGGGWRYKPGEAGDTSVSGWHVMALKSALMAGLDVPESAMRKAQKYLDGCVSPDEGYGYVGPGATPTMSAVGLLCRQYLQSWGPQNIRLIKGIDSNLKTMPPGKEKNIYYYYYATQVLHHFGGTAWKEWNDQMREILVKTQEKTNPELAGSWSSEGDRWGRPGGRLMVTSLSLLTLEVYYRHMPLYYREAGEKTAAK